MKRSRPAIRPRQLRSGTRSRAIPIARMFCGRWCSTLSWKPWGWPTPSGRRTHSLGALAPTTRDPARITSLQISRCFRDNPRAHSATDAREHRSRLTVSWRTVISISFSSAMPCSATETRRQRSRPFHVSSGCRVSRSPGTPSRGPSCARRFARWSPGGFHEAIRPRHVRRSRRCARSCARLVSWIRCGWRPRSPSSKPCLQPSAGTEIYERRPFGWTRCYEQPTTRGRTSGDTRLRRWSPRGRWKPRGIFLARSLPHVADTCGTTSRARISPRSCVRKDASPRSPVIGKEPSARIDIIWRSEASRSPRWRHRSPRCAPSCGVWNARAWDDESVNNHRGCLDVVRRRAVGPDVGNSYVRESDRRRLPLQLRAAQSGHLVSPGSRPRDRHSSRGVLPVHDRLGWVLAFEGSASVAIRDPEPVALRERGGTCCIVGARHAVLDAIDVRAAAHSVLDRTRDGAARVLQPHAAAASKDDAGLGTATWTTWLRATRTVGSRHLPRSRHREVVPLLGIVERLPALRDRARQEPSSHLHR